MDPSIFFGRTRTTRQTLKSKQETSTKESEKCEVTKDVQQENCKVSVKNCKPKLATPGKENDAVKETITKRTSSRAKKPVKTNEDDSKGVKGKGKPVKKIKEVHFEEQKEDGTAPGSAREEAPSGPVYRNVCRSDVVSDPLNEYDFEFDSDSPSEKTTKKKKRTISRAKSVKKAGGVVKWDPSKRPIKVKAKPIKKSAVPLKDLTATSKNQTDNVKPPTKQPAKAVPPTKQPAKVEPPTKQPAKAEPPIKQPAKAEPPTKQPAKAVISTKSSVNGATFPVSTLPIATTPDFHDGRHCSSTPVSRQPLLKKVPSAVAASKTGSKLLNESLATAPSAKGQALPVPSIRLPSTPNDSLGPSSPSIIADAECAGTSNADASSHLSLSTASSLKSRSAQTSSRGTSYFPLPKLSVRESPSFREPSQVFESPLMSSPGLLDTERSRKLNAVTSTPVTRSKKSNGQAHKPSTNLIFDEPPTSDNQMSLSPAITSDLPALPGKNNSDGNLAGIFDDLPRTSVIPTRMFSTHRGTIFMPEGQNAPKRKLPELSPSKEETSSRVRVVKFPAPQTSSTLEQCFGFDDEDDDTITVPQIILNNAKKEIVKKPSVKKPNLTIQEAQALLRGQCKLASPASVTPKSIQTKLTDFVSSTPTSTPARVVPTTNENVLTPSAVPLFGEEQLETDVPSPFSQPTRRSYDRFRPVKRVACGDEVLSGDEDAPTEQNVTESKMPEKKKNKSYKRTKKPKETPLDNWAAQLASHFDEVEEVELQLE